jgi:hypothetical protein
MSDLGHRPYFRWAAVLRASAYDDFVSMDRNSGQVHPGVAFLTPEANEALWSLGIWSQMNRDYGTIFDIAEEEVVTGELAEHLADLLTRAADRMSGTIGESVRAAANLLREAVATDEEVIVTL